MTERERERGRRERKRKEPLSGFVVGVSRLNSNQVSI